jgi:hypothetical protein
MRTVASMPTMSVMNPLDNMLAGFSLEVVEQESNFNEE